jgi:hypothetical protein
MPAAKHAPTGPSVQSGPDFKLRQYRRDPVDKGRVMQTCANVTTVAFAGLKARPVDVQVQLAGGQPGIVIVGLGDKAIAESRERVCAAFASIGLAIPAGRLIVSLAPADLPKEGTHYDLPIAMAMMAAIGALPTKARRAARHRRRSRFAAADRRHG